MDERDKVIVDPELRYPSEGLLDCERQALRVIRYVSDYILERTRDVIQVRIIEDGLSFIITREHFEIRLPTVEWTCGAYGPAPSSRFWKRVNAGRIDDEDLAKLIRQAQDARRAEFRPCKYCGKSFPPEHRTGNACHGCASNFEGIVF